MNFYEKVYRLVKQIPQGQVSTYGLLASQISSPRAAQLVGFALRSLPAKTTVPWQRVVNSAGMISIENLNFPKEEQVKRLQQEGIKVEFKDGNFWVDLGKYLWQMR